jgi:hypothetical protein
MYTLAVAYHFWKLLYPRFPNFDPETNEPVIKYDNVFAKGDGEIRGRLWLGRKRVWSRPLASFKLHYDWDAFEPVVTPINVSISESDLRDGNRPIFSMELRHVESGKTVSVEGPLLRVTRRPDTVATYSLLTGKQCSAPQEPAFGRKSGGEQVARGVSDLQVRLVYDRTAYPKWMIRKSETKASAWLPRLFLDDLGTREDQLLRLNATGTNMYRSDVTIRLMSAPRFRFHRHMSRSLEIKNPLFVEESEEISQMRDLFANTCPLLLITTLVISVAHVVLEILAFKSDVTFWQGCDTATLSKYMSVQSIVVGVLMQVMCFLYLLEASANLLVLGSSAASILVDSWKIQRVMMIRWKKFAGIPVPTLCAKFQKEKSEDFDNLAMRWLSLILAPFVLGYCVYTLVTDCYRSWYSYFVTFAASCMYSIGFVLMTPQVFINYKHKSVAYLPWRKFVYRAISTFIDDFFAMIIRMPTMHRLSCFRDDIVFLVYLYQRRQYPVDHMRALDDETR